MVVGVLLQAFHVLHFVVQELLLLGHHLALHVDEVLVVGVINHAYTGLQLRVPSIGGEAFKQVVLLFLGNLGMTIAVGRERFHRALRLDELSRNLDDWLPVSRLELDLVL